MTPRPALQCTFPAGNAFVFSCLLLLSGAAFAQQSDSAAAYSEQVIHLANGMIATGTSFPEVDKSAVKSAVLLVHGWSGQMDEVGDMYKRLAAQLADNGIASLRINIRGESEGEATNYRLTSTFASRITDAQTGLDYLLDNYPNAKLGAVGFSLGGPTTMMILAANPEAIDTVVFWSTAGDPSILFSDFTEEQKQTILDEGEITLPYWVDLTISREHFLGFDGYDVFSGLESYKGALLSIRGTQDYVPPQEEQLLAAASAKPEEVFLIEGADHIFNSLEPDSPNDEILLEKTLDWFLTTLPVTDH